MLESFFKGKAELQFGVIWVWMRTLEGQEKVKAVSHEQGLGRMGARAEGWQESVVLKELNLGSF